MARLPIPGSDKGAWGNILNDYLAQSHNPDGSLKSGTVGVNQIQDGAVSIAIASQINTLNIFDYLNGAQMPTATTGDMGALLNTALMAAQVLADANPTATYIVGIPAGTFRITSEVGFTQPRSMERVGIKGAGKHQTRFIVIGGISFFHPANTAQTPGSLSEYVCEECVWQDFTVDMTGATAPDPTGASYKVFKGAGWRDCHWSDIYGYGAPATVFGTDYLVRCSFTNVDAKNAGRAGSTPTSPWTNGSRSGFGIAVGWSEEESAVFMNCRSNDNLRSGFLFEYQESTSTTHRQRMILIGCEANGNYVGLSAAGASGVKAIASRFNNNTSSGVYIGPNEASTAHGGADVEIIDSEIADNTWGIYGTSVATSNFSSNDYSPVTTFGGTRIIRTHIRDNRSHGIYARRVALATGGFFVIDSTIEDNSGSGLRFENEVGTFAAVRVEGNTFIGSGRHLDLLVPLTSPIVERNTFLGGSVGVAYHPARISTKTIHASNTFYDTTTTVEITAGALTDASEDRIATNPAYTYVENLTASGSFPGTGWISADLPGIEATWSWVSGTGVQPTGSSSGQDSLAYRDMGSTGIYADMWIGSATASVSSTRGVAISYTPTNNHMLFAGVIGTGSLPLSSFYALWKMVSGTVTRVWESSVPIDENHVVALRREAGSTVTQMFIDGQLVHQENITDVPVSQYAGLYGVYNSAGNRRIRAIHIAVLS